jgi:hypothetical protein
MAIKKEFAIKIFNSLIYLSETEFTEFNKVLKDTGLTNKRKKEFLFLAQFFAHIEEHNNFTDAYSSFPDDYFKNIPIPSGQEDEFKQLGYDAVNFHLNFQSLLGLEGETFSIALQNVATQNLLNDNVKDFAKYSVFKDVSNRFFSNIKTNTKFAAYAGMAYYLLYVSGDPIGFTESYYFKHKRKFGVPNSLLFRSHSISSDRKLNLSIKQTNEGFQKKLQDVTSMVSDLRNDPKKVEQFVKDSPKFVKQYGLTIKDIDQDNIHLKATVALGDKIVIDAAKEGNVDLFLERLNELGLYRLINFDENDIGQRVSCSFVAVCAALVFVGVAVAAAVVVVFQMWVGGVAAIDEEIGPDGIFSGQIIGEIKVLEIAKKLGKKGFNAEVVKRMQLDAENLLIQFRGREGEGSGCNS